MAEEATQQAVTEQTEAAETPTEDGGAQETDSLDEILNRFDQEVDLEAEKSKPSESEQQSDDIDARIKAEVEKATSAERMRVKAESDLKDAVNIAKGDSDLDPDYVEFRLRKAAETDTRLLKAWLGRDRSPGDFQKAMKAFGRSLVKASDKVDSKVTEDREAAKAAVQGASTPAPAESEQMSQRQLHEMSPMEFEKLKRQVRRDARA